MSTLSAKPGGPTQFYPRNIPYAAVFNDDDSDNLTKTYASAATNLKKQYWSFWIKRANVSSNMYIMYAQNAGATDSTFIWFSGDKLRFENWIASTPEMQLITTPLYRDPTNWMHIECFYDSTNAVPDTDDVYIKINGEKVTAFDTEDYPTQNQELASLKNTHTQLIFTSGGAWFDGYGAEVIATDGQDYVATGELKNGVHVPITSLSSVVYGNNGFNLDFASSGNLGLDVSGNGNSFATNGSPAQVTDTPTDNHVVISSVSPSPGTLQYGNTKISGTENGVGTFFVSSDKWAWKVTSEENGNYGIIADDAAGTQYVAADVSGEVIEFELDLDGMTLKKRVDGGGLETVQDPIASGKAWAPHFEAGATVDFGATSFTPTDSDYKTLCSANIASNLTILNSINSPAGAVYVSPRLGTGAEATISDVEFDVSAGALITIKNRDQADGWKVHSTVGLTGVDYYLAYDANTAQTQNANGLTALSSTGYTIGTGANGWNDNTEKFIDWVLREGAAYGLDLVTYEGDGNASQLINHSGGAVPSMMWVKNVDVADSWAVYHSLAASDPETDYGVLDTNVAFADLDTYWNDTAPTSTQFTVGTIDNVNALNETYVAILFFDIPGLCKAFAYTGNANADGPYIPLGFRAVNFFTREVLPAVSNNWFNFCAKIDTYNPVGTRLYYDGDGSEGGSYEHDILSQGIKIRLPDTIFNGSGKLFVGFAWAEQFGCYSNAR